MALDFETLWRNYPSPSKYARDDLFDELGWPDLKSNTTYHNTCAIRLHYCLIKSGVNDLDGRLKIKAGPHKGSWIEPGQVKLSNLIKKSKRFGQPSVYKISDKLKGELANKKGIVSFMRIPDYTIDGALSGHIDLVRPGTWLWFWNDPHCQMDCYWNSAEFWFWEL
jgi:hypothetical protein